MSLASFVVGTSFPILKLICDYSPIEPCHMRVKSCVDLGLQEKRLRSVYLLTSWT